MYIDRIGEFSRRKFTPEKVKEGINKFEDVQAADHFKNQFEVPVLFYSLCSALAITKGVTPLQYYGAWAYVGLRIVHAFIHCTYNNIMHRFYVYAASCAIIFSMWGIFGWQLATGQH